MQQSDRCPEHLPAATRTTSSGEARSRGATWDSFCGPIGSLKPGSVNRIESVEHAAFLPRARQRVYLPVLSRSPKNGTTHIVLDSTLLS